MLVLAWDTSTAVATLALAEFPEGGPARILAARRGDGLASHSRLLAPMVREALGDLGLSPSDPDLLAAGRGPGSFTGLRTGLALAKGLAMGAGVPALGVCSLDVLAASLGLPERAPKRPPEAAPAPLPGPPAASCAPSGAAAYAAPLVDARHGEVFTALYRLDPPGRPGADPPAPVRLSDPEAVRPADLFGRLSALAPEGARITLLGPGLELVPEIGPPFGAGDPGPPRAEVLAALAASALREARAGRAAATFPPEPIYGRSPDIFKTWTPPARLPGRRGA